MTETEAHENGLHHDISTICSESSGSSQLFQDLGVAGILRTDPSTGRITSDQQIVALVTDSLPKDLKIFWMHQAV